MSALKNHIATQLRQNENYIREQKEIIDRATIRINELERENTELHIAQRAINSTFLEERKDNEKAG